MDSLEEKLREAACIGDRETVEKLIKEDININSRHSINGWTALHWACKRGHEDITRILLNRGADPTILTNKNETAAYLCSNPSILSILGTGDNLISGTNYNFSPNCIRNSSEIEPVRPRIKHSDINNMPTTMLPSVQNDAFEDWLYKHFDFKYHNILLLWQSDPCVVIGRHQNPYIEANISELKNITQNGVKLARRNSGGGTVYHDNGNLNLSFLTKKECYNRKYNLEIISKAVFREYEVSIDINKREDLVIDEFKVSGTAAKLGRPNAYHHCTLLVNVNKKDLSKSLKKTSLDIQTNATKSVRSKIMNLSEKNPNICIDNLIKAIGVEYLQTPAYQGKNVQVCHNIPQGFKIVQPSDQDYPGLSDIRKNFESWDWIFGKTPKFQVTYVLPLPPYIERTAEISNDLFEVVLVIENGIINEVKLPLQSVFYEYSVVKDNIERILINKVFNIDCVEILKEVIKNSGNGRHSSIM